MQLTSTQTNFITRWGEMGVRWGINRTVAQVHALLFVSENPIDAAEISTTLSTARSNISTALRELESWGLIRKVHVMGDRKDHFEAHAEVWEMFRLIVRQRKRREFDPLLETAKECFAVSSQDQPFLKKRFKELVEFLEMGNGFFRTLDSMPHSLLKKLMSFGPKLTRLLGGS